MRKNHDKLIRDRIPELMDLAGVRYELATLDEAEYANALREKVLEEAREVSEAPPEALAAEIADLLEVLAALQERYGLDDERVRHTRYERLRQRGGFFKRLRLSWTEE